MIFKQQIKNPYKINYKLYVALTTLSVMLMALGYSVDFKKFQFCCEIIKNLGFGCFASTIVAFIIEIGNIRDKNRKANELYENIYSELRFYILRYLKIWSEFCCIVENKENYKTTKKTWQEWYSLSKDIYNMSNKKRQNELKKFLIKDLLLNSIGDVNNSINKIFVQKNLLEINDIYNNELENILKDFEFEFRCAREELDFNKDMKDFWKSFDALNNDIFNYIDDWSDIKYYNNLKFEAYSHFDKSEYVKAIYSTYFK